MVKPRAEAERLLLARLRTAEQARAEADRRWNEVREVAAANSPAMLGHDHPEAWSWRELDRLMGRSNTMGRRFVEWGLAHREQWARSLGHDPLNGQDPGGAAVTQTPAAPPAKPGA
jgi:hypothetical protein